MTESHLRRLIMTALATVTEPCSIAMRRPINICEMGLVEKVDIDDGRVSITLCLTDPGCVHFSSLRKYIRDVTIGLEGVKSVDVAQTTKVLWTPDRVQRLPRAS
jgi:metal-sulfur cluster biosynthetic enzyme